MTSVEPHSYCNSDNGNGVDRADSLFISVIMAVRNEARFIERTLTQLVTQDDDPQRFESLSSTANRPTVHQICVWWRSVPSDTRTSMSTPIHGDWAAAARNVGLRQRSGRRGRNRQACLIRCFTAVAPKRQRPVSARLTRPTIIAAGTRSASVLA